MYFWLKAILRETWSTGFTVLSALSTLATFFWPQLAGLPRSVLTLCTIVGFAIANLRVLQKQQKQIADIQAALDERSKERVRKAELIVHAYENSCFSLVTAPTNRGQSLGLHVNLDMAVENAGDKGATV